MVMRAADEIFWKEKFSFSSGIILAPLAVFEYRLPSLSSKTSWKLRKRTKVSDDHNSNPFVKVRASIVLALMPLA